MLKLHFLTLYPLLGLYDTFAFLFMKLANNEWPQRKMEVFWMVLALLC